MYLKKNKNDVYSCIGKLGGSNGTTGIKVIIRWHFPGYLDEWQSYAIANLVTTDLKLVPLRKEKKNQTIIIHILLRLK